MHFPTWVDLKGEDAVPETVHHVVVMVDPQKDTSWQRLERKIQTDGVHNKDNLRPTSPTAGMILISQMYVRKLVSFCENIANRVIRLERYIYRNISK